MLYTNYIASNNNLKQERMMLLKNVYIPSIDGKDLYLSNLNGEYSLRRDNGELNTRKFIASFDYSLESIKLEQVYWSVYHTHEFRSRIGKKSFSTSVINVTFDYSVREYNRRGKNIYIKYGFNVDNSEIIDSVCVRDGELIAIRTDEKVDVPINNDILGKYFSFEDGVYKAKNNIPVVKTTAEIREELYKNGFICDGIKYIRFKRSSGSSRVGKCLFIDEKLYPKMHEWEMCGINLNPGDNVDLASLEPYIALTLSSIIGTVQIPPQNILVIDDYESTFTDHAVATRLKDGRLVTKPETIEITNKIWDGQSLMDRSIFLDFLEKQRISFIKNPVEHGMLLLRARFFKSCCFNTNIQKWFADNGITDISQLNGYTRAKKIEDIKLITTPSSIKYLKFGSLDKWLDTLESTFGVVKYEKKTQYFDGRMVQTHYQLLNTLQMTEEEVAEFLSPSLEYVKMIKRNPAFLRHNISFQYQTPEDDYSHTIHSRNDIVYSMLGINEKFSNTKIYRLFRDDLVKSYVNNLKCGHILVRGNYSTLCGNPIEMLKQAIGTFNGNSVIEKNTIHNTNFNNGMEILGSRSPHITVGDVLLAKNIIRPEITEYMNPTNEIVYVNSIGENLLERLGGADYDSDVILLTDNEILIKAAKRNYDHFPVPTKCVPAKSIKRRYTPEQQADLDIKTSVNKIGEIVNLSAILNSMMWDRLNNGATIDDVMELYCDIAQLSVLSNLEIDAAKRENPADTTKELKLMRNKWVDKNDKNRQVRPLFFKFIDEDKGYRTGYYAYRKNDDGEYEKVGVFNSKKETIELSKNSEIHIERGRMSYELFKTTMDYLVREIETQLRKRVKQGECVKFSDVLIPIDEINGGAVRYSDIKILIEKVRETKELIGKVWNTIDTPKNKYNAALELKEALFYFWQKRKINEKSLRHILSLIDKEKNSDIASMILEVVFNSHNTDFYRIITMQKTPVAALEEDASGDIDILGFKYRMITYVPDANVA